MFALLGAQGAGLLHALNTVHEACAEHGELVHSAGVSRAGHVGSDHFGESEAPNPASPDHEDSDESHEHCELLPGLDTVEAAEAPSSVGLLHTAAVLAAAHDRPRATQRLDDAPKTSPPHQASA